MKMKITILEDSVIESERLKNGIRKYGQQYDWDIEIDEYESGEEYFSKNSEGTTIQASAFFLDIQNPSRKILFFCVWMKSRRSYLIIPTYTETSRKL